MCELFGKFNRLSWLTNLQIKEWCNCFKDGRTSAHSGSRLCRPPTSRNEIVIDQVWTLLKQDRPRTCESGGGTFNFDREVTHEKSIREIRAEAANDVAKVLTSHKICRITQIVTLTFWILWSLVMDESWVYRYNLETRVRYLHLIKIFLAQHNIFFIRHVLYLSDIVP